jgi:GxxExxY protein
MTEIIYKDEVYAIIGAAMEVYNQIGAGFLEPVYQEILEIECVARKIPAKSQYEITIYYKGKPIKKTYIADLFCYDKIIVEIKTLDKLTAREESQLINYLKASGIQVGLLINFGARPSLEWRRFILTNNGVRRFVSPPQISENSR